MNLQRVNVALAIVLAALMISLVLPIVQGVRMNAARMETINHMKLMGLAMHAFHDTFKELPPAFDRVGRRVSAQGAISYPVSIHVHLLAYCDTKFLYNTFATEGTGVTGAVVESFITKEDGSTSQREGVQNFAANLRVFSAKGWMTASSRDMPPLGAVEPSGGGTLAGITNGSSNTIAFATKLAACGDGGSRYADAPNSPYAAFFGQNAAHTTAHYSNPRSIYQWAPRGDECLCRPLMAQTYWPKSIVVGFADGTARQLPGNIDPGRWNALLTPQWRNE